MLCCEMTEIFIQISTVAVVVMLLYSLLMLAIDIKTQLKLISIVSNYITNKKAFKFVQKRIVKRSNNV